MAIGSLDFFSILLLVVWALLWILGGCWLARTAFNLRENEVFLAGLAIGWLVETLFANLLARILPLLPAFWIAATLVFFGGVALTIKTGWKNLFKVPLPAGQIASLVLLSYVFIIAARGLAIFDDYAHMPTLSIMAAGEIPPRFSLNPDAPYGYHYFLLLFSSQLVRIGNLFPWQALDVSRGISTALAILMAVTWTRRLTKSRLAGFFGGLMAAFGSGTRWLLLLLPESQMLKISKNISLIASGSSTAPDLFQALVKPWGIDGGGPFAFPFAYANGITGSGVMQINNVVGGMSGVAGLLLLLTFNRWTGWPAALLTVFVLGAEGLIGETAPLGVGIWLAITVFYVIWRRTLKLPTALKQWWLVIVAGILLSVVQGGAWTDFIAGWIAGLQGGGIESYQTVGFGLTWSPAIVSSHLGVLELRNLSQLLVALAEIGPIILVLPLLVFWGWKAFRASRWYEVSVILSGLATFAALLVQFTGSTGVRNTSRLYGFINLCFLYATPLVWLWIKKRRVAHQILAGVLGLVVVFGGLMMFSVELIAAPKPVYSTFITRLDVDMMQKSWNRLEPEALVFDIDPVRAPTVFGRYTNSSRTWFEPKPEWKRLSVAPLPEDLLAAGFSYVYMDDQSWNGLAQRFRQSLKAPCVAVVQEVRDGNSFRRLLDIRGCR